VKQKLGYGIVLNLLVYSILLNFPGKVYGTPKTESNLPATTVKQWRLPFGYASRSQLNINNSVAIVTNIIVQSTPKGIKLILNTTEGKTLRWMSFPEGNNLIVDISNAKLQLPESKFIRQNPIEGISKVKAFTLKKNQIRVVISGVKGTPTGQTVITTQGLTINATPFVPSLAETTPPEEGINIIVTAQKKPEKLKDVPISLTTLSQEEIEDGKIDSFRDVAANTPNFFTTVSDRAFNFQTIRGLGNANFLVRDSISFFIDDVPYDNVHQFLPGALFDVERIEVLRGPQSTLYGRNSQAGVINVISRQPTNSPEITLGASYGNFNQRQLEFSASDAVIKDKLKFRIAGIYDARDGFTENTFLDDDANNLSSVAGRANLVWTPSDKWNIAFNATGAANNDGDNTYVPIDQEDPFETELDIPGDTDLSINTQSLRIGYEGTGFKLTSITARNGTNHNYNADGDYSPEDLFEFDVRQETTVVSQVIRLQSPDDADRAAYPSGNRLRWLVGGYFQDRSYDIDPQQTKFSDAGGAAFFGVETAGNSVIQGRYDQTTFASFGQIDFKPVEPLTLTAGLRYENYDEELSRRNFDIFEGDNSGENTPFTNSSVNDDAVIPKFAIEYSFSPNISTYASVTRGYKPPTQNYSTDDPSLRDVEAEKSWSYELGVKSSWLEDRLSVNVAGFINDVSDLQVALTGDTGFFEDITNAEVLIKGLEIEAKAKPLSGLDLIAGFGYTDAEYTDYINPFTGEDLEGNQLLYTPEFTLNLAAQYRTQFGLFSRVELQGLGNYFFDDENNLKQDSLALVNARIGYEAEQYGIYLFVNNLFDKEYLTSAFVSGTTGSTLASYGDRRIFGLQVSSKF
jgi:iron complex outermembrane recepter protein